MITPKALIFDCDGTLADTMPLHWRAWQTVAQRYDLHFPEDRFYSLGGVPSRDILKMLSEEQNRPLDPAVASREKEAEYLPYVAEVREIEAVVSIARANFGKIPMAVASGGIRPHITKVLGTFGDSAIVPGDRDERRCDAAGNRRRIFFLEAARQLGVAPQDCRAYEDTDLGIQAILAAGMEAVDVRDLLRQGK